MDKQNSSGLLYIMFCRYVCVYVYVCMYVCMCLFGYQPLSCPLGGRQTPLGTQNQAGLLYSLPIKEESRVLFSVLSPISSYQTRNLSSAECFIGKDKFKVILAPIFSALILFCFCRFFVLSAVIVCIILNQRLCFLYYPAVFS